MYVATVDMSSCGGCHNALLAVGEPLIALLSKHTLSFSSPLMDRRSISPSDVVVACGAIGTREELEVAGEIARTSRKVIAVGSCAVYGGVCGSGAPRPETDSEEMDLPHLLNRVLPLDSTMDIELYIPGCPPPPNLIFEALKSVLEGYTPPHFDATVCSECPQRVTGNHMESWDPHPSYGAGPETCHLNAGHLCLGPVTRGGCHAACTSRGAVCTGCRGPSEMVLSSQLHSIFSDMVKYVSLTTRTREDRVAGQLQAMLRIMYLFTCGDPVTWARAGEKLPTD